jgi:hypothetical protein
MLSPSPLPLIREGSEEDGHRLRKSLASEIDEEKVRKLT